MTADTKVFDPHSISVSSLLVEIVQGFRDERIPLLERWRYLLHGEPSASMLSMAPDADELEHLLDQYIDALEVGSVQALELYARTLAAQRLLFPAGTIGFLNALLVLRDLLGRALSARLQRSPARLVAALDTFEPSANRISEAVALGIVEEHVSVIRSQQDAIRQLSTPVLQVRAGLLIHPIVGPVDIHRVRQLTEDLLISVRRNRGRVVVMDLTGVPSLDVTVATQLVRTVEAVRLLGATLIISGISPEAARALATTGLDLGALRAVGDLEDAIIEAEARLGLRILSDGTEPVATSV